MKIPVNIIYVFLIVFLSAGFLPAQNNDKTSAIFNLYESSVVYIEQVIFFKSADFKNPEVFREIEAKYQIKFFDEYKTLGSGTGFFINKDGNIITNHHVIDTNDLKNNRKRLLNSLIFKLSEKMPQREFELKYNSINEDLTHLTDNAEFSYRVKVNNYTIYKAQLIKSSKNFDLALLKIEGTDYNFIPVGDINLLKVGDSVIAIGYPVPDQMKFLKDFKATLSTGNISSIRDDVKDGIQHTAAINPGNSGGPLLDLNGRVIGVNRSIIKGAEGIHFAVPAGSLINWLKNEGMTDILESNKKAKKIEDNNDEKNKDVNITVDTGISVFVNFKDGADIFVNNELIGKTPLLIKTLKEGRSALRVENQDGYDEIKINADPDIKDIYTYVPVIKPFTGRLFIESSPAKSYVYIDAKFYGETPVLIQNLKTGKYNIELRSEEYKKISEIIDVERDKLLEKKYVLERTFLIRFKNELPPETIIELVRNQIKTVYTVLKPERLEKGKYEMSIINDYLDIREMPVAVDINNEDVYIDFKVVYKESDLVFNNLRKGTAVIIDDIDITKLLKDNVYRLNYGKHSFVIKYQNYQTLYKNIDVKKSRIEIKMEYKNGSISF